MNLKSHQAKNEPIQGIRAIRVRGFKSLLSECTLDIRPLTILAGANNSGKSSAIQPLLLLKQTLEASYDPGALLLYGPNVRFTSEKQLFAIASDRKQVDRFMIAITNDENAQLVTELATHARDALFVSEIKYRYNGQESTLQPEMEPVNLWRELPPSFQKVSEILSQAAEESVTWKISRERCFLVAELALDPDLSASYSFEPSKRFEEGIRTIIHVPGLRGNPVRTYKTTAFGATFPGTFENYVASIIHHWQVTKEERLHDLEQMLAQLGLTWRVEAKPVEQTQVELRVGRLPRPLAKGSPSKGRDGMVNIADVGFGVSQVLPVLVALLVASPGQMVYIEQPEIHLHPRAQAALAKILIDAAKRGVRVVAETHSSLLLTAIQTEVARGKIVPDQVMLHWFQRDEDGITQISSTELDETGAFGEWPVDFADVEMEVDSDYFEAVETKLMGG
jgi:predicted ATPase